MPVTNVNKLIKNRVKAIKEYHFKAGLQRAQLDVSGGIDSAVMLGLLAKAVGPENITAVYSDIHSSSDSERRAEEAAKAFGVNLISINLTQMFDELTEAMVERLHDIGCKDVEVVERMEKDPTILGSIRSCIRAPIGRGFNRMSGGGIRHGTGNECEDRWLRFYQKGGDGEVDTNTLAMLSKGEIYQLAIGLGVPESILTAVPSPDLQGVGEAHNDEDELRALTGIDWTYSRVDHKTGEYTRVGTIERMSRFMDAEEKFYNEEIQNHWGAHSKEPNEVDIRVSSVKRASELVYPGVSDEVITRYRISAIHQDTSTKHKENPNCPVLGGRWELLDIGAITNELPRIE